MDVTFGHVPVFKHRRCMHLFFFFPGPPNRFISRQLLQSPQSACEHPEQSHLDLFLPTLYMYVYTKSMLNGHNNQACFFTFCKVLAITLSIGTLPDVDVGSMRSVP